MSVFSHDNEKTIQAWEAQLLDQAEFVNSLYWHLQSSMAKQSYSHSMTQNEDMIRLGKIAEVLKSIREARGALQQARRA